MVNRGSDQTADVQAYLHFCHVCCLHNSKNKFPLDKANMTPVLGPKMAVGKFQPLITASWTHFILTILKNFSHR